MLSATHGYTQYVSCNVLGYSDRVTLWILDRLMYYSKRVLCVLCIMCIMCTMCTMCGMCIMCVMGILGILGIMGHP